MIKFIACLFSALATIWIAAYAIHVNGPNWWGEVPAVFSAVVALVMLCIFAGFYISNDR